MCKVRRDREETIKLIGVTVAALIGVSLLAYAVITSLQEMSGAWPSIFGQ